MPCLLLTLGVALVCSVQATDMPQTKQNLELPKTPPRLHRLPREPWLGGTPCSPRPPQLAGTWHSMAMATNNVSLMVTVKSALRVHVTLLWPTPEDHLEIVLHRWENNSCVEKKVLGEKTENPKKFKINYMGANEAMLLDTDYDNFLFLCLTDTTTRIQCLMCQYLARVLVEDDEIMKGFIRAFRPLHKRLWYLLDLRKTEALGLLCPQLSLLSLTPPLSALLPQSRAISSNPTARLRLQEDQTPTLPHLQSSGNSSCPFKECPHLRRQWRGHPCPHLLPAAHLHRGRGGAAPWGQSLAEIINKSMQHVLSGCTVTAGCGIQG
ncbi:glycodelin-like isoform X4 [Macaca fascicularis]|uniref:glycodelin-like isoform X4 n=1 Tax=Macaca fascicularis TaxID=9541 RepID=UPI0032B06742